MTQENLEGKEKKKNRDGKEIRRCLRSILQQVHAQSVWNRAQGDTDRRHALFRVGSTPGQITGGIPRPSEQNRRTFPVPRLRPQHHNGAQGTGGETVDVLD